MKKSIHRLLLGIMAFASGLYGLYVGYDILLNMIVTFSGTIMLSKSINELIEAKE